MKTGFKIALAILVFVVGAGLGHVHKLHKLHKLRMVAEASARQAQKQSDEDADACRSAGGMAIYGCCSTRLAGCYSPAKK
jgi:uncharacterized membrane protein